MLTVNVDNIWVSLMVVSMSTTILLIILLVVVLGLIGLGLAAAHHVRAHYQ